MGLFVDIGVVVFCVFGFGVVDVGVVVIFVVEFVVFVVDEIVGLGDFLLCFYCWVVVLEFDEWGCL